MDVIDSGGKLVLGETKTFIKTGRPYPASADIGAKFKHRQILIPAYNLFD